MINNDVMAFDNGPKKGGGGQWKASQEGTE
jgi:hypothetical protein